MAHTERLEAFRQQYINLYEEASICNANTVKYKRLLVKAQSAEKTKIKRANTLNEKKKIVKMSEFIKLADKVEAFVEKHGLEYPTWFE